MDIRELSYNCQNKTNQITMKNNLILILCLFFFINESCQTNQKELTESNVEEIIGSASEVVKKVFDYSNDLDFETGLNYYSDASNAYFITDGKMKSLSDLREEYRAVGLSVESLHNKIESWHAQVLTEDVVNFTLPVQLTLKLKGIPEFTGKLVWTATLQKLDNEWMIVQSHESWLNCAEVAAALLPVSG